MLGTYCKKLPIIPSDKITVIVSKTALPRQVYKPPTILIRLMKEFDHGLKSVAVTTPVPLLFHKMAIVVKLCDLNFTNGYFYLSLFKFINCI